jgi:hypothetical protein
MDRKANFKRPFFDRGRGELSAPPRRAVGLGKYRRYFNGGGSNGLESRDGKFRRSEKNDTHENPSKFQTRLLIIRREIPGTTKGNLINYVG